MCDMNKNHLLTLYFHEGTKREERKIQMHVNQCKECRDYLLTLDSTNQTLHQWQDESPLANTWDLILAEIPGKKPVPALEKPTVPIRPILKIILSIGLLLVIVYFIHDKISILPFLQTVLESWPGRFLGSFGVTTVLVSLLGILATLSLVPVIILESQSKKYRYYFN